MSHVFEMKQRKECQSCGHQVEASADTGMQFLLRQILELREQKAALSAKLEQFTEERHADNRVALRWQDERDELAFRLSEADALIRYAANKLDAKMNPTNLEQFSDECWKYLAKYDHTKGST